MPGVLRVPRAQRALTSDYLLPLITLTAGNSFPRSVFPHELPPYSGDPLSRYSNYPPPNRPMTFLGPMQRPMEMPMGLPYNFFPPGQKPGPFFRHGAAPYGGRQQENDQGYYEEEMDSKERKKLKAKLKSVQKCKKQVEQFSEEYNDLVQAKKNKIYCRHLVTLADQYETLVQQSLDHFCAELLKCLHSLSSRASSLPSLLREAFLSVVNAMTPEEVKVSGGLTQFSGGNKASGVTPVPRIDPTALKDDALAKAGCSQLDNQLFDATFTENITKSQEELSKLLTKIRKGIKRVQKVVKSNHGGTRGEKHGGGKLTLYKLDDASTKKIKNALTPQSTGETTPVQQAANAITALSVLSQAIRGKYENVVVDRVLSRFSSSGSPSSTQKLLVEECTKAFFSELRASVSQALAAANAPTQILCKAVQSLTSGGFKFETSSGTYSYVPRLNHTASMNQQIMN